MIGVALPPMPHEPYVPALKEDDLSSLLDAEGLSYYLMGAVHDGDRERVARALHYGANPNAVHPSRGINALHLAVQDGRSWAIPMLVDHGANVENAIDRPSGTRPLGLAVMQDHDQALACCQALLAAGADPNAPDQDGHSPFKTLVAQEVWVHSVQHLERHHALLQTLLAAGGSLAPDSSGSTLLHAVVGSGVASTAQKLIDAGIVWARDANGHTPLDLVQQRLGRLNRIQEPDEHERCQALRSVFEDCVLRQTLQRAPSCAHEQQGLFGQSLRSKARARL